VADRATFTSESARRIAKVVRRVEAGNRDTSWTPSPPRGGESVVGSISFRVATFTGSWGIGSSKVVTFKNQTTTPNTASASNLFFDFPTPAGTVDCGIAREGTAWYLIDVPITTATSIFATSTDTISFVSSIDIAATLNTNDCAITVTKTVTSGSGTVFVPESTFTSQFLTFKVN